jgi:hypothetical protein
LFHLEKNFDALREGVKKDSDKINEMHETIHSNFMTAAKMSFDEKQKQIKDQLKIDDDIAKVAKLVEKKKFPVLAIGGAVGIAGTAQLILPLIPIALTPILLLSSAGSAAAFFVLFSAKKATNYKIDSITFLDETYIAKALSSCKKLLQSFKVYFVQLVFLLDVLRQTELPETTNTFFEDMDLYILVNKESKFFKNLDDSWDYAHKKLRGNADDYKKWVSTYKAKKEIYDKDKTGTTGFWKRLTSPFRRIFG